MIDLEPDGAAPLSERHPAAHAEIVEAIRRYNVGPDWTRAEVLDLVRGMAYQRAALDELHAEVENANEEAAVLAIRVQKLRNALRWVAATTSEQAVRTHARQVLYDD